MFEQTPSIAADLKRLVPVAATLKQQNTVLRRLQQCGKFETVTRLGPVRSE